jgi:hypothetical protein
MKILFGLVALLITIASSAYAFNWFSKSDGFQFENYTGEQDKAKAELLKLHPIGTPVAALRNTLEKAGASIKELSDKEIYHEWRTENFGGALGYNYTTKTLPIGRNWGGAILYDKAGNIISLGIGSYF